MIDNWLNKQLSKLGEGFYWHWQNLNDRPGNTGFSLNDCYGPGWAHGRAWFNFGRNFSINPEWNFKNKLWGAGILVENDEPGATFNISFVPVSLHLTIKVPYKWTKWIGQGRRDTSISFHNGAVWVNVWCNDNVWTANRSWWKKLKQRQWNFNLVDFLFGRWKHTERTVEERDVLVPMPEGNYPCTAKMFESTWTRPRWPFPKRMLRATVTIKDKKCIPYPGKGTCSWNCGMDGTYVATTPSKTVEEAVGELVGAVLRRRRRYGGINWQPEAKDIPDIVESPKLKQA